MICIIVVVAADVMIIIIASPAWSVKVPHLSEDTAAVGGSA